MTISFRDATHLVSDGGKSAMVNTLPSGNIAVNGLSFFITFWFPKTN